MANAYSAPLNYGHAIDTNEQQRYISAVHGAMQQKFDVNLAKIDDLIAKVSSVPLARDKDKRYLGDKLQGLLSMVDANSKIDLTDNVVARQITNYIGGAIDDEVKTQISNSQKIYSYNSELDEIKSKKPGEYNSANDSYAMYKSGLSDYMAGKRDDLGRLEYTPYTDINKEVLEELTKLKALKGDQVIQTKDGAGSLVTRTLNGLKPEEIYQYMPELLSSKVINQLKINGWAKVQNNMPAAKVNFEQRKKEEIETIDIDIKQLTADSSNTLKSEAERADAKGRLERKTKEKQDSEDTYKNINLDDPEQLGGFLELNAYKYSIAKIASGRENVEYKKDEQYYAQRELELAERKEAREERESLAKAAGGLGADGKPIAGSTGGYVGQDMAATDLPETVDYYSQSKADHNAEYNKIMQNAASAYNSSTTTQVQRDGFNSRLNQKGYEWKNGKPRVIPGKEKLARNYSSGTAVVEAFVGSELAISHGAEAKEITKADEKRMSLMTSVVQAEKKGYTEEFNKDSDEYIRQLKVAEGALNNPNITDMAYGAVSDGINTLGKMAKFGGAGFALGATAGAIGGPLAGFTGTIGGIAGAAYGIGAGAVENYGKHADTIKAKGAEITKFVNDNGGWANLKNNIKGDVSKIKKLADLTKDANNVSAALYEGNIFNWGEKSLNTVATQSAGKYVKDQRGTPGGAYFTTGKEYNITSEAERKVLTGLFSQKNGELSAAFKPEEGSYTAYMKGENIIVTQKKGLRSVAGVETQSAPAMITLEKGDSAYKRISMFIDTARGQEALNTRVAGANKVILPYKTPAFLDQTNKNILGKADENMKQLPKAVVDEFTVSPDLLLTKKGVKEIFTIALANKMPQPKIDQLVSNISSNMQNMELKVVPMDGVWGAIITNKANGFQIKQGKFNNNDEVLDTEILNMVKNYPQVVITNSILEYVLENPGEEDLLFQEKK